MIRIHRAGSIEVMLVRATLILALLALARAAIVDGAGGSLWDAPIGPEMIAGAIRSSGVLDNDRTRDLAAMLVGLEGLLFGGVLLTGVLWSRRDLRAGLPSWTPRAPVLLSLAGVEILAGPLGLGSVFPIALLGGTLELLFVLQGALVILAWFATRGYVTARVICGLVALFALPALGWLGVLDRLLDLRGQIGSLPSPSPWSNGRIPR